MKFLWNSFHEKVLPVFQAVLMMIWLANLAHTDAYFSVYVLIAFCAFYTKLKKMDVNAPGKRESGILVGILSILFSLAVLLANYPLFTMVRDPERIGWATNLMLNLVNTAFSLIGGFCVAHPILNCFFQKYPKNCGKLNPEKNIKNLPIFFFLSIVSIQLVHLFLVEYPGNVTEDPFTQISEMVSGQYSNFNTFWHTMLLRSILTLGYRIFGDANAAVAVFCVFQALVLAFAFTYCLMTMYYYGVPGKILVLAYLIYAVLPYNIALSITIWKDVLFAAGTLLTLCAVLRRMAGIPSKLGGNGIVFILGSVLFLLSRTNAWVIYLLFFAVYLLFVREDKQLLAMMGAMALVGWAALNPMLSFLNIPGSDKVESLSVPIQQVSRVIADGCELTEEETELLSRVIDVETVPERYTNWLSDPMKAELRAKDPAYFEEHLSDYARLWWQLGCKHPISYGKAWIDQTKGYWNGGYPYAMYSETVVDNPYGVEKAISGNPIAALFRLYFGLSRHIILFEPLHSIGLHIWIIVLFCILNVVNRRKEFVLSVPLLAIVLGLCLGTPVYCSFRYVYPLFVSFPLIVSTALFSPKITK